MTERILLAAGIVILGLVAYRGILFAQQRLAARGARVVDTAGQAALLVFTSPTCAPCKLQQIPIAERILSDWGDRVEFRLVDVTEQPDVAGQFGVWSLPTTIVLDPRQQVVAINQGVANESKLRGQLRPFVE